MLLSDPHDHAGQFRGEFVSHRRSKAGVNKTRGYGVAKIPVDAKAVAVDGPGVAHFAASASSLFGRTSLPAGNRRSVFVCVTLTGGCGCKPPTVVRRTR